jgi:hypothetical protein
MRAKRQSPNGPEVPDWAVRMSSSVTASSAIETNMERGDGYSSVRLANGSTLLKGPGVFVVALPGEPDGEDVQMALDALRRAGVRGSDILALAFPPDLGTPPPDYVSFMADCNVAIVRDQGQDSLVRATAYMLRVLGLRNDALEHLTHTMTMTPSPSPSPSPSP